LNYTDALLRTIEGWNTTPISDEWLLEKFRKKFVNTMTTDEAFESIDPTIGVLQRQSDESTAVEVLQTIITLARQSDTTEVPPTLLKNRDALTRQFSQYGDYAKSKLQELLQHYRLD
jgi:hypothetical protein